MGIHLPESNFQPHFSQFSQYSFPGSASHPPFPEPPIEEKSELEKSMEVMLEVQKQLENMTASSDPQNFQNSCSSFPEQLKGKSLFEKTMEFVQETKHIMQNTIEFPCPPNVHTTYKSCHFGNLASISSYQPELDQHYILDSLASDLFPKIELEDECKPELQFSDSSSILESISTPI